MEEGKRTGLLQPVKRVVIEGITPEVEGGRFPAKRIVGDSVVVEADLLADGQDPVAGALLVRHEQDPRWKEVPLQPLVNDRWRGQFTVEKAGTYRYTLEGWVQPHRDRATRYDRELQITVDRERARFGTWYEIFPRSCSSQPGRHGSFRDLEGWLPYISSMGFDVLYLPPIHPIARTQRKGKNNLLAAGPNDPGSVFTGVPDPAGAPHCAPLRLIPNPVRHSPRSILLMP